MEIKNTDITHFLTFQVKEIKDNIAIGAVKELSREPRREDYFTATGEVEFGGGYQDVGHFNDGAFEQAQKLFNFQCYPIGKYKEKQIEIPEGIKLKPGQFIRVKYVYERYSDFRLEHNTPLFFHKDRVGEKIVVKKYNETI